MKMGAEESGQGNFRFTEVSVLRGSTVHCTSVALSVVSVVELV